MKQSKALHDGRSYFISRRTIYRAYDTHRRARDVIAATPPNFTRPPATMAGKRGAAMLAVTTPLPLDARISARLRCELLLAGRWRTPPRFDRLARAAGQGARMPIDDCWPPLPPSAWLQDVDATQDAA